MSNQRRTKDKEHMTFGRVDKNRKKNGNNNNKNRRKGRTSHNRLALTF